MYITMYVFDEFNDWTTLVEIIFTSKANSQLHRNSQTEIYTPINLCIYKDI